MPDFSKMFACLSRSASVLRGFGLILILAGGIDIAMNCALILFFLPLAFKSLQCFFGCIVKIVSLIRFIHIHKNGIPVEGRVYHRRESNRGENGDGEPLYSYRLWVVYDEPILNMHTECEAVASAKYEPLKETSSSTEVDEENFTETEQKIKCFNANVSEATYEAVNRSGNDSIEVLVLNGRASVISQNLSWDLLLLVAQLLFLLFPCLVGSFLGIVLPFTFDSEELDPKNCPWHVKFSYAFMLIIGWFLLMVSSPWKVKQESTNDGSPRADVSFFTLPELQAYKRKLKQKLKKIEMDFHRQHGRMPVKAEKEPIRIFYKNYNNLKNQITSAEKDPSFVSLRIQWWKIHTQFPGNASQGSMQPFPDFNSNATDSTNQSSSLPSGPRITSVEEIKRKEAADIYSYIMTRSGFGG